MLVLVGLSLMLMPQTLGKVPHFNCMPSDSLSILHKYYHAGDLLIGGIISQIYFTSEEITFTRYPHREEVEELMVITQNYQHILSLAFAAEEINENPHILSNVTLGFHINNNYFSARYIYLAAINLLSTQSQLIPNYKCDIQNTPIAVIGGPSSDTDLHMATILNNYKVPQLTYGSPSVMNNKIQSVFFQWMFPNRNHHHMGILQLLLHFKWTWIGVIYLHGQSAEELVQRVLPIFSQKGICFDFIERLPKIAFSNNLVKVIDQGMRLYDIAMRSSANVLVVHGEIQSMMILRMLLHWSQTENRPVKEKIWIMTAQMEFTSLSFQRDWDLDFIHGALSFAIHSEEVLGFQEFLQRRNPQVEKEDGFIKDFWKETFKCWIHDSEVDMKVCTGDEKLEGLPGSVFETSMTGHSYSVYNAVHAVVHAVHAMLSPKFRQQRVVDGGTWKLNRPPWQLHHFLRSISFNNSAGEEVSFDPNGELAAGFDIINWIILSNQSFLRVKVGRINLKAPPDKVFTICEEAIVWPSGFNQTRPSSRCNDICHSGYSRGKKEGKQFCCYDCHRCPEGMISNNEDMDYCFKCLEDHYPNKDQNGCLSKDLNVLSFEEPLGISLAVWALYLSLNAAVVLGVFIKHQNTPIVKANNRNLTYSLLFSIMLCFLCSLLFIGQPHFLICLLRQTAFGIIFTMAVSCILAKTVTVVLVFMATKPGSWMRKWVGKRVAILIILGLSFVQAIICLMWLCLDPPFLDFDMHSLAKEIIMECNEGSASMFYYVLGYMGFLALISFIVAFFARTLPDSFNEAKFITFSMLLFCSLWASFVPTYLSTKGKYMVAVEVFSILASSAGLLVFIFFPKCFIILLRPELNCKEQLARRNKLQCDSPN